jgi:DNA-directed RNA polymerase subunit F
MIGKESKEVRLVHLAEVKEILEKREKEREMTYEQQLAYEHAKKHVSMSKEKADKLKSALLAMGVSERTATKIVDVAPKGMLTLKQIMTSEQKTLGEDELQKILALVKGS